MAGAPVNRPCEPQRSPCTTKILPFLCDWVRQESPTRSPEHVSAMASLVQQAAPPACFTAERIAGTSGFGDMLVLRGGPQNGKTPALLIGHLDTVHPLGTLRDLRERSCRPFRPRRLRHAGTTLIKQGGIIRPPYERTDGNVRLLKKAQVIAASLGLALPESPQTGGGSDGNFTAALGIPTLDGLGADGAGAPTLQEYATLSTFQQRTQLIRELLRSLQ
jgi:acetylornithine deacetylase/succinyl-diaminopimelate desuccinylase-like protein